MKNILPTERDFDPSCGGLDARCAWKNFGGLTLEEAGNKFRERPEVYQEDFMFMGGAAFAFYFPVIEDYVHHVVDVNDGYDPELWILAHCIKNQFAGESIEHLRHLGSRVFELSLFVRQHIERFGYNRNEQQAIVDAWIELETYVKARSQV